MLSMSDLIGPGQSANVVVAPRIMVIRMVFNMIVIVVDLSLSFGRDR